MTKRFLELLDVEDDRLLVLPQAITAISVDGAGYTIVHVGSKSFRVSATPEIVAAKAIEIIASTRAAEMALAHREFNEIAGDLGGGTRVDH
jgi:hypothetical protein